MAIKVRPIISDLNLEPAERDIYQVLEVDAEARRMIRDISLEVSDLAVRLEYLKEKLGITFLETHERRGDTIVPLKIIRSQKRKRDDSASDLDQK